MKKFSIGIVVLVVGLAAGNPGLNAQNARGNQYIRNQRGACVSQSVVSPEKSVEIKKLSDAHQKEMDNLRTDLRTTRNRTERVAIRTKMDDLQVSHRNQIVELGAVPANTPHAGYTVRGRAAGRGQGLGMGRGYGRGTGQASVGGRGLGPCGWGRVN